MNLRDGCGVEDRPGDASFVWKAMTMALWQEAAVVVSIVVRVVWALWGDWGVGAALASLVVAALAVESAGARPQHWFRATQAPGILLGAITPPLAMAARMSGPRAEFWTSVACSFVLLGVLSGRKRPSKITMVVLLILGLGLGFQGVAIAAGSAFVFHSLLQAFPACASPGEAMLVAHGLTLYLASAVLDPLLKKPVENVDAIVHAVVLGMLLVPVLYRGLLSALSFPEKEESASRGSLFCFTVVAVVLWVAPAWLRLVVGVSQHPVLWILRYVMEQPAQRLGLCVYWVVVIGVFSLGLHRMAASFPKIMIRKGFHIMVVVMFVPALAYQADFLRISFALALGVFILVETIRVQRIPPLGEKVQTFLRAFTDSRDSDVLIISHFSLLLGCAIPVWLSSGESPPLAAYAGILSLGIGDTMASVVGYNFGSMRLSSSSQKTWEGTIAGIGSIIVASVLVSFMGASNVSLGSMVIAATCAGLMEAFTSQLDNAFVPIVYYSLLSL